MVAIYTVYVLINRHHQLPSSWLAGPRDFDLTTSVLEWNLPMPVGEIKSRDCQGSNEVRMPLSALRFTEVTQWTPGSSLA